MELLGYDTQELGLVLGPVAVGRADVDHLEEEGGHGDKREEDEDFVSVGGRTEGGLKTTSSSGRACSDLTFASILSVSKTGRC